MAAEVGGRNLGPSLRPKWDTQVEASIDGLGKPAIEPVHPLAGTWTNLDKPRSVELLKVMADQGDADLNIVGKSGDR